MQVEMNGKKTSDETDIENNKSIQEETVKNDDSTMLNDMETKDEKLKKELSHLQQNKWKYISVFVLLVAVISASLCTT